MKPDNGERSSEPMPNSNAPVTRAELKEELTSIVTLLTQFKESLERELQGIQARLDVQTARLERQAALIQTPSRPVCAIDVSQTGDDRLRYSI